MPGSLKNAQAVLKDGALRTWCSDRSDVRESSMVSERRRAIPHIKTFSRASADGKVLDWSILTSCNISRAAWGAIQKEGTQFCIKSWEMGILFTPSTLRSSSSSQLPKLVTTQHRSGDSNEFVVPLPTRSQHRNIVMVTCLGIGEIDSGFFLLNINNKNKYKEISVKTNSESRDSWIRMR